MKIPDRRIVLMRPGTRADGLVERKNCTLAHRRDLIAGASFIVYVARGEGWFRFGNLEGRLCPRTLILASAGLVESALTDNHEKVVVALSESGSLPLPFARQLSPTEGADWYARLKRIVDLAEDDAVRAEHVRALKRDLAPHLWRMRAPYAQETLKGAFDLLWQRDVKPLSIEQLADTVGYTPKYLSELVHKHTGRPIGKLIADIRMSWARHDLENTAMPIAEIAVASGYDDPAYFSRAFRRLHGVPPAVWRIAKRTGDDVGTGFTMFTDELKREIRSGVPRRRYATTKDWAV